jgi:hypothetical protein
MEEIGIEAAVVPRYQSAKELGEKPVPVDA